MEEIFEEKEPREQMAQGNEDTPTQEWGNKYDFGPFADLFDNLKRECQKVVIGQDQVLDLMMICIIADGHILLEGVPGIAKTLAAKTLAKCVDVSYARVQFTPDLMPADVIGTSVYNTKDSDFEFRKGPIFANIVLIDEINRAPAKTQAALFEVMAEKQISFDGHTYLMDDPFLVIATQNPIEQEGTYRLPEGQLDRFLMKINMQYPSANEEVDILTKYQNTFGPTSLAELQTVIKADHIKKVRMALQEIIVEPSIIQYIATIIQESRDHGKVYLGASPRAGLALLKASKVMAMLEGRDFIIPEDIHAVGSHVLNHRIILTPEAEMEEVKVEDVLAEIFRRVEVPR